MDLAGNLVMSSRQLGQPQERSDNSSLNTGVAVRIADGSRRTAGAADEQCLRCGCSSLSCTVVLCAVDIDELFYAACRASTEERPASTARRRPICLVLSHHFHIAQS